MAWLERGRRASAYCKEHSPNGLSPVVSCPASPPFPSPPPRSSDVSGAARYLRAGESQCVIESDGPRNRSGALNFRGTRTRLPSGAPIDKTPCVFETSSPFGRGALTNKSMFGIKPGIFPGELARQGYDSGGREQAGGKGCFHVRSEKTRASAACWKLSHSSGIQDLESILPSIDQSICLGEDSTTLGPKKLSKSQSVHSPAVHFAEPPVQDEDSSFRKRSNRRVIHLNQVEFSKVARGLAPVTWTGVSCPPPSSVSETYCPVKPLPSSHIIPSSSTICTRSDASTSETLPELERRESAWPQNVKKTRFSSTRGAGFSEEHVLLDRGLLARRETTQESPTLQDESIPPTPKPESAWLPEGRRQFNWATTGKRRVGIAYSGVCEAYNSLYSSITALATRQASGSPGALSKVRLQLNTMARRQLVSAATLAAGRDDPGGRQKRIYHGLLKTGGRREGSTEHSSPHVRVSDSDCSPTCPTNYKHIYRAGDSEQISCGPHDSPSDGAVNPATFFGSWGRSGDRCVDNGASDVQASEANNVASRRQSENAPVVSDSVCPAGTSDRSRLPSPRKETSRKFQPPLRDASSPQGTRTRETEKGVPLLKSKARQSSASHIQLKTKPIHHRETPFSQSRTANQEMRRAHTSKGESEARNKSSRRPERDAERILLSSTEACIASNCSESQSPTAQEPPFLAQKMVQRLNTEDTSREPKSGLARAVEPAVATNRVEVEVSHLNCSSDSAKHKQTEKPRVADGLSESRRKESTSRKTTSISHIRHWRRLTGLRLKTSLSADHLGVIRDGNDVVDVGNRRGPKHRQCALKSQVSSRKEEQNNFSSCSTLASERGAEEAPKEKHGLPGAAVVRGGERHSSPSPAYVNKQSFPITESRRRWWPALMVSEKLVEEESRQRVKAVEPEDAQPAVGRGDTGQRFQQFSVSRSCGNKETSTEDSDEFSNAVLFEEIEQLQQLLGQHMGGVTPSAKSPERQIHFQNTGMHQLPQSGKQTHRVKPLTKKGGVTAGRVSGGRGSACNRSPQCGLVAIELGQEVEPAGARRDTTRSSSVRMVSSAASSCHAAQEAIPIIDNHVPDTTVSRSVSSYVCPDDKVAIDGAPDPGQVKRSCHSSEYPGFQGANVDRIWGERPKSALIQFVRNVWCRQNSECNNPSGSSVTGRLSTVVLKHDAQLAETPTELRGITVSQDETCTAENPSETIQRPDTDVRTVPSTDVPSCRHVFLTTVRQSWQTEPEKTDLERPDATCVSSSAQTSASFLQNESHRVPFVVQSSGATRIGSPDCQIQVSQRNTASLSAPTFSFEKRNKGGRLTHCFDGPSVPENEMPTSFRCGYSALSKGSPCTSGISPADWTQGTQESRSGSQAPDAAASFSMESERRTVPFKCRLSHRVKHNETAASCLLNCSVPLFETTDKAKETPGCRHLRASWTRFACVRRVGRLTLRRRHRSRAVKKSKENDCEGPDESRDDVILARDHSPMTNVPAGSRYDRFDPSVVALPLPVTPRMDVTEGAPTIPKRGLETFANAIVTERSLARTSGRSAGNVFDPLLLDITVNSQPLACRDPNGDHIAVDDFKESPSTDRTRLASSPAGAYLPPCDRHSTASPDSEHAATRSLHASTVTHLSEPEHPLETTGFSTELSPLSAAVVRDGGNLEMGRETADRNSSWSDLRLQETSSAGRQKTLRHSNGVFRLRIRHRRSTPRGPLKCATPHCLLKRSARARRNKGAHRGVTPAGERTERDLTRTARRPLPASARREKPAFVLPGSRTADRAAARAARRKPSSSSLLRHSVDDAVWGNCHLNSPSNECLQTGCPGPRSNAVTWPLGEDKISLPQSQQTRGQTSNGLRGLPRHMAERAGQRLAKEKEGKPGTKEAEDKKVGEREGHRRTKAQGPSSECSSFCRGDSKKFPGSPPVVENPVNDVGRYCAVRGQIREDQEGTVAGQKHLRCETNRSPLGSPEQARGSKLNWDGEEVQHTQEAVVVSRESPGTSPLFCPFDELFGLPDLIPDEWYGDVSKRFAVDAHDKTRVRTQRRNSSRGEMACLSPCSDFVERTHGVAETGGPSPVQQLQAMQIHREQVEQKRLEAVHALHSPRGLRRDPVALRVSPSSSPPLMLDVELDSSDFTACHFPEDLLELIGSVEECSPSALREAPSCPSRCRSCRDSASSVSSPGRLARSGESSSGSSFYTSSSSISVSSQEETASSPSDRTPPSRGAPSTTPPSSGVDSEKRRVSRRKSRNESASDSASEPESARDEKSDDEQTTTKPKQPMSKTKRTLNDDLISSASSSATDDADVSQCSDSLSDSHLESSDGSSDDNDINPEQPRAAPESSLGKLGTSRGSFVDPLTDNSFNETAEMRTEGGQCDVFPRTLRKKANRQQIKNDRGKSGAQRHRAGRRRRSRSQPPWSSLTKRPSRAQHSRREACLKRRLLALENVCMSHEEYMSHFARKMRLPGVENKVACIELTKAKRALMPQLCFVGGGPEFLSKDNSGEDSGSEKGKSARLEQPQWEGNEEEKGFRSRHRAHVLTIESAVFSCLQKKGWIMNKLLDTHFFDLKWKISDVDEDYRCLRREQFFNHFQNNRVMTTKAGLSRSFRLLAVEEQVRTDAFFPRCYDLSTLDDCMDFLVDYSRCEAVTVLLNYLRCCQAPSAEFEAIMRQPAPDLSVRQSSVLLLWMAYHLVASWLHELDPDCFLDRHDPLGDRRGLDPQRLEVFATHAWDAREQPVAFRRAWHSLAKCSDGRKETGDHSLGESRVRQFLPGNCEIIPGNDAFDSPPSDCSIGPSEAQIFSVLRELQNCWPLWRAERGDVDLRNLRASDKIAKAEGSAPRDAMQEPRWNHHNIWIMKPSSSSRASGVYCLNNPWDILKSGRGLSDRLVQKYIERPLLIFSGRKFDMRQWVLIRSFAPLKVYAFTDLYLRLCSEPYDLRDLHNRFRHISNWNLNRLNSELNEVRSLGQQGDPSDDGGFTVTSRIFSDCSKPLSALQEALDRDTGTENFWDLKIKPQIRKLILQTARAARPSIVPRSNCFELYGFDILLDAEYRPWLIEVNLSPACTARAHWHKQMVTSMAGQLLQILIDEPRGSPLNSQSCVSTGKTPHWELLFDESVPPNNAVRTFPPIEPVSSGTFAQAETPSQAGNPFLQFYSQHSAAAWTPGGQGSSRQKTSRAIRAGSSYSIDRIAGHRGITKERRGPGVALGGKADLWNKFMVTGERIERQELLELDTFVRINEAVRHLVRWWRQTAWRRRAAQRRKVKVLEDIELDVFFGT
ncbi:UNVERIFIED_CONTAM: Tubulin-tyrosine ligase family protein [Hammondia hammondi]|eukprot:XP_008885271.1 Tubulin-tyrosine ligase family protein [Hammondia hammondi]